MSKLKDVIAEIREKLDRIESQFIWMVKPEQRFRIGQRVKFSNRAKRAHLVSRNKLERRATIKSFNVFSVVVQLDEKKHPVSYHHAFFNPVRGPQLF